MRSGVVKFKKKMKFLLYLILFFFIIYELYSVRYLIVMNYNTVLPRTSRSIDDLSEIEKLEDFRYCYNTMINGNPAIKEYVNLYGFNVDEKKLRYEDLIRKTENNYEFYCLLDAFLHEIPSYHTDIVYPETDDYNDLHCFGSAKINANRDILSLAGGWKSYIEKESLKYLDAEVYTYKYIDGNYYFIDKDKSTWDKLLRIDDTNIDTYVMQMMSIYKPYYDGKNEKTCRRQITFNDRYGERIKITIQDKDGKEYEKEVYTSVYLEEADWINDDKDYSNNLDYRIEYFGDICYIQLNNMNKSTCKKVLQQSKSIKNKKFILDLRENTGGYESAIKDYLAPAFFSKEKKEMKAWYMPYYGENIAAYKDIFSKIVYGFSKTTFDDGEEVIISKSYKKIKAADYNKKRDVVILTSRITGSAADEFVYLAKKQPNITVIGNNTGGEGLMGTFVATNFPNSKLVFLYMPSKPMNLPYENYMSCGTAPDIYASNTVEDYLKKDSANKIDSVLKKSIEYLNK